MHLALQLLILRTDDVSTVARLARAMETDLPAARAAAALLEEDGLLTVVCSCVLGPVEGPEGAQLVTGGMAVRPEWVPDSEVVQIREDFHGLTLSAMSAPEGGAADLTTVFDTAPRFEDHGSSYFLEPVRIERHARVPVGEASTQLLGGDVVVIALPVLTTEMSTQHDGELWASLDRRTRRSRAAAVEALLGADVTPVYPAPMPTSAP
ncbi:MAG: hypothetical protein H6735_28495 [Alphaproteobacteria bacterium]|nr:hypothetical protein [Alphaproteobacteria bacterium]